MTYRNGEPMEQGDIVIRPSREVPGMFTARAVRPEGQEWPMGSGTGPVAALDDLNRKFLAWDRQQKLQAKKAKELAEANASKQVMKFGFGGRR